VRLPELKRPTPPPFLFDEDLEGTFARAEDVEEWMRDVFIEEDGPLYGERHEPLSDAYIGVLWATKAVKRKGVELAGTAEMPDRVARQLNGWVKEQYLWQMRRWFGTIPDFCIRLLAPWAESCEDVEFLATCKHELCHCDQAYDKYGSRWFRRDGSRVWTLVEHDVTEFIDVVEDFGPVGRNVAQFVSAASKTPRFEDADVRVACGNCLARAA
jgi:hypothetical protein